MTTKEIKFNEYKQLGRTDKEALYYSNNYKKIDTGMNMKFSLPKKSDQEKIKDTLCFLNSLDKTNSGRKLKKMMKWK